MSHHVVMNHALKPPTLHGRPRVWGGKRPSMDYPTRPILVWMAEGGDEDTYYPAGWYSWTKKKGWVAATTLDGYRGSYGSVHSGPHRICAQCGQKDHPTTEGVHSLTEGCQMVIIDGRGDMFVEPAHFCSGYCLRAFKTGENPRFTERGTRGARVTSTL